MLLEAADRYGGHMTEAAVHAVEVQTPAAAPAVEAEPDLSKLFVEEPAAPPPANDSAEATEERATSSPTSPEANAELVKEPEPGVAARIAAAKKAEIRAQQSRARTQAKEAELARKEADVKERESKLTDLRATAKTSKAEAIKGLGYDTPEDFLREMIAEGTPEQKFRAEIELARRDAAEARAEAKALREEREQEAHQRQSQLSAAQIQRAQGQFVDFVGQNASKYPTMIDEFTPTEIAGRALNVVKEWAIPYKQKTGIDLDDDVVAEHLEQQAKARAEARNAWRSRVKGASPSEGVGSKSAVSGQVSRPAAPRTMTNGQASQKASAPKPWTQEDADAESLRILEEAMRQAT